jgi:tetratricopeptide (TPR) repeat protein/transglutaminase-like putative cysteine protease
MIAFLGLLSSFAPLGSAATPRSPAEDAKAVDYSKEAFVVERMSSKARFENDGTYSLETTVRVRVQSQAGLQQFGLLKFPYASATSTMEVVYVRVIKSDNRVVQTPPENVLDMPAEITRQAPFYSDLKEDQVAVKGLAIGDTLEFQSRVRVTKPLAPGQFWFSYNFFNGGIALQEELQIGVPRDRFVKVQSPKVQPTTAEEGAYRVYTWKAANRERAPGKKASGSQEPEDPQLPSVQLATFRSWGDVGQWFRGLAAPQAVPTAEIQAKARELTAGAKTDSEKARAIYDYVSTKFRYIGISLGIGRYQPHAAAEVLANDYGDCKDKHTLFAALLAAAGVKAYPALIGSEGKIDPDVPSPGQFDHVITAVPQEKGYLFLDTTPEVASFGHLLANLRDKQALVIPDSTPALLVQTPADPPFRSFFSFQADGALDDSGTLDSKMQMTFRGDVELIYRLALRQAGEAQWKDVMQQISSNLGFGGTVSDVTATSPDAIDSPFHIEYSYNRRDYSDWSNKRIRPPFPPVYLPDVPDDADNDAKPVKLGSPDEMSYQAALKLPAKSSPRLPPPVHLEENFAEYRSSYSFSDGALHVERRLITKAREISPAQFDAYRKFRKALTDDVAALIPLFGDPLGSPEAQALVEQGRQAWQQQNLPRAVDAFQRAVDNDPKFAQAWLSLGAAHLALGHTDQGIEEMKKAIALDPTQVNSYKYLGSALMAIRRQEEALEVWKQLEKASPEDTDAPRNIVLILFGMKRYSEAVPELESAVSRNSQDSALLLQLGAAYLRAGDKDRALPSFQKALDLDSSANTLNSVAYDLADHNLRLDEALRYAEQAVKKQEDATADITLEDLLPEDPATVPRLAAYWDTLGWVHFRMGHLDQAEKYLNAGWYLTQDPVIADHLGQLYEKEGKKHEAAVAYGRALAAGHAPEETEARLRALRPGGKYLAGESITPAALQDLRVVKLTLARKPAKHASAEFFLLFASGPKVVAVKFLSGSEDLRDAEKALAAAKFDVRFPDEGPTQILRRGLLDCEPEVPACMLALFPPNSVHSPN